MLILIFFIFISSFVIKSESEDVTNKMTYIEEMNILRNSVNFSYMFAEKFLNIIRGKKSTADGLHSVYAIIFNSDSQFFHVKKIIETYIGYILLSVVGLLFIVSSMVSGCCYFCCRFCGRCGAYTSLIEEKFDRFKRNTLALLLGCISTIYLCGLVLAFINNQLLYESLNSSSAELNGFIQTRNGLFGSVDAVNNISIALSNQRLAEPYRLQSFQLETISDNAFNQYRDQFIIKSHARIVDEHSKRIIQGVCLILESEYNVSLYESKFVHISKYLEETKNDILYVLENCSPKSRNSCNELKAETSQLQLQYHISENIIHQYLKAVSKIKKNMSKIMKIREMSRLTNSLTEKFQKRFNSKFLDLKVYVDETTPAFIIPLSKAKAIIASIRTLLFYYSQKFEDVVKVITESKSHINFTNLYYMGLIFCIISLSMVVYNFLGLAFGQCGSRPDAESGLCNRGVGANLLLSGLVSNTAFNWAVSAVVIPCFLFGGICQTEMCRYLSVSYKNGSESMDEIFRMAHSVFKDQNAFNIDSPFNYSLLPRPFKSIFDNCGTKPLFESFFLLESNGINHYLSETSLRTISIQLMQFKDQFVIDTFDGYFRNVDKVVSDYLSFLKTIKITNSLPKIETPAINFNVEEYIRKLETLSILKLYSSANDLRQTLIPFLDFYNSVTKCLIILQGLYRDLLLFQTESQIMKSLLVISHIRATNKLTESIKFQLQRDLEVFILNHTSHLECKGLQIELKKAFYGFCESILQPFNGFWVGLGICITCTIPASFCAAKLIKYYRRAFRYHASNENMTGVQQDDDDTYLKHIRRNRQFSHTACRSARFRHIRSEALL